MPQPCVYGDGGFRSGPSHGASTGDRDHEQQTADQVQCHGDLQQAGEHPYGVHGRYTTSTDPQWQGTFLRGRLTAAACQPYWQTALQCAGAPGLFITQELPRCPPGHDRVRRSLCPPGASAGRSPGAISYRICRLCVQDPPGPPFAWQAISVEFEAWVRNQQLTQSRPAMVVLRWSYTFALANSCSRRSHTASHEACVEVRKS